MTPREIIDWTLQKSGWGTLAELEAQQVDRLPAGVRRGALHRAASRYPDKKFRFKPDWQNVPAPRSQRHPHRPRACRPAGPLGRDREGGRASIPFRLATSPSRDYLNSSFNEMPTSQARHGPPRVKVHPDDLAQLGIADGARVRMGNERGEIVLAGRGLRRRAARRRHRREHRPQRSLRGRRGHQHADQRRTRPAPYGGAAVPRQPRVDREGVSATDATGAHALRWRHCAAGIWG